MEVDRTVYVLTKASFRPRFLPRSKITPPTCPRTTRCLHIYSRKVHHSSRRVAALCRTCSTEHAHGSPSTSTPDSAEDARHDWHGSFRSRPTRGGGPSTGLGRRRGPPRVFFHCAPA